VGARSDSRTSRSRAAGDVEAAAGEIGDPIGRYHRVGTDGRYNQGRFTFGDGSLRAALSRTAYEASPLQDALQLALLAHLGRRGFVGGLRHPHESCMLVSETSFSHG
jgi:hypothetical protein